MSLNTHLMSKFYINNLDIKMGNVHIIKNTNKRPETAYISKNRSLYNVVITVLNYHSSSDQVILEITYSKHQGAYTKWIGYHKL